MMKFVIVSCAIFAVSYASNFDYLDTNLIEYDSPPRVISAMPYPYQDVLRGNRVSSVEVETGPAYDTILAEEPKTELVASKLGLLATGVSFVIAKAKLAILFLIKNWSALMLGSSIALGICKFTPLCNKAHSFVDIQREIRSFATPQRIARATEFVENAIKKYNAMQ